MKDGKAAVKFKGTLENNLNKDSNLRKLKSIFTNWKKGSVYVFLFICKKWTKSEYSGR